MSLFDYLIIILQVWEANEVQLKKSCFVLLNESIGYAKDDVGAIVNSIGLLFLLLAAALEEEKPDEDYDEKLLLLLRPTGCFDLHRRRRRRRRGRHLPGLA